MLPTIRKKQEAAKKGAFARALERLGSSQTAKRAEAAPKASKPTAAQAVHGEEFFIVQRCAVTGERFKTLFTRRADGKFVARAQMKLEEQFSGFVCDDGTAPPSSNIRAEEIAQMPDEPCPCCGRRLEYQHVRCGTCRELVCTGRSYEIGEAYMFVCHKGCGGQGFLRSERITSYDAQRTEPPARHALEQERRPALPVGKAKLLGRR